MVRTAQKVGVDVLAYLTWMFERRGTHRRALGFSAAELTPTAYRAQLQGLLSLRSVMRQHHRPPGPTPPTSADRSLIDYSHAHPTEALLVVEVAVSSLGHDLKVKALVYALAGVPELWIVDTTAGCVHVHRDPLLGVYTRVTRAERGEILEPRMVPGVSVATAAVLP